MFKFANRILNTFNSQPKSNYIRAGTSSNNTFLLRPTCFNFSTPKYLISPYDTEDTKVLVADSFSRQGLLELENSDIDVTYDADLSGPDLAAALAEVKPDVLVVRSTRVDQAIIDANENL